MWPGRNAYGAGSHRTTREPGAPRPARAANGAYARWVNASQMLDVLTAVIAESEGRRARRRDLALSLTCPTATVLPGFTGRVLSVTADGRVVVGLTLRQCREMRDAISRAVLEDAGLQQP